MYIYAYSSTQYRIANVQENYTEGLESLDYESKERLISLGVHVQTKIYSYIRRYLAIAIQLQLATDTWL